MKNNFIKQKINTQNKPKTSPSKRNRVLAYVLLAFMVFWTISSILGVVAFFNKDNVKTAHADGIYNVYRDSIISEPSSTFFYKSYSFTGQSDRNFSSPFRITVNTTSTSLLTIYIRFNESNFNAPNGFQLFYNGDTQSSPAFTRILLDGVTYYRCQVSTSLLASILGSSVSNFSIISLNYDYSTHITYNFDLFITRGSSDVYSPAFFEGFLLSNSYDLGYSDGLSASKTNLFVNGRGRSEWLYPGDIPVIDSHFDILEPNNSPEYFINGEFLFTKYFFDLFGSNVSNLNYYSFEFKFLGPLTIGVNNHLSARFIGEPSFTLPIPLFYKVVYYNSGEIVAESTPSIYSNADGSFYVDDLFKTTNRETTIVDGESVTTYGDVLADSFEIYIGSKTLSDGVFSEFYRNGQYSSSLAFPQNSTSDYYAGYIAGQLSFDGESFFDAGYKEGQKFAKSEYERGVVDGAKNAGNYTFLGLLGAVVDAPIQALTGLLNFEILGFNMMTFFMSILTLAIVIFVVRLFI